MEHDTVAGEAAEHAGSGFPPFDQVDTFPSQLFWLVVTFGLLYFMLAWVLLPRIERAIKARASTIGQNVADAAAMSEKADASVKAFEARIAEARAGARALADKAKSEAGARIAAETARVEAELAAKLGEAEAQVSKVRAAAMANVSAVAEDAAGAIVEKLSGVRPDAAAVKRAVQALRPGA